MATSVFYKLAIDNLHKRFGEHEVLKGVSLHARAGDVISIIGSSGSGKSTFLRCMKLRFNSGQWRIPAYSHRFVRYVARDERETVACHSYAIGDGLPAL
jgi:ABC-type histidine transport system ATPase subunit